MKIQFCDLCNESVPESDFAKGKALMRQGRVVCSACDSSMSNHKPSESEASKPFDATRLSAGVGPGAVTDHTRPLLPLPRAANQRASDSNAAGGWIGVLALLLAAASAWFFWQELSLQGQETVAMGGDFSRDVGRLEGNLDRFSLGAQHREEDLEQRLQGRWERKQVDLEQRLAKSGQDLVVATQRLAAIEGVLTQMGANQQTGVLESGRRLDELLAQSMKSRLELEALAARLTKTEGSIASSPRGSVVRQVSAPANPYAALIADLQSEVSGTRWNAVSALGDTKDPAVVPYLIPMLKDPGIFVRMAVARVFGDLGSPLPIEALIGTLEDEEPVVREAAMSALHILTNRDFRFEPHGKAGDRSKRVKAWRDWWKKARDEFLGGA